MNTRNGNLVAQIAAAHFVANAAQVEQLARELYASQATVRAADGTYLKVLIVACQAGLGKPSRRKASDIPSQFAMLESVNETYYAAVLRGVTTADIAVDPGNDKEEATRRAIERNRRSTFARSAKSTLAAFVGAGGDMRALDVAATTKGSLRAFVDKGRDLTQRHNATVERAQRAILRIVSDEAATDPDGARARVESLIDLLQTALDEIPANAAQPEHHGVTTIVAARGHPRSSVHQAPPQMHRGA